eukprot:5930611-Prymnesium_polylepis.2
MHTGAHRALCPCLWPQHTNVPGIAQNGSTIRRFTVTNQAAKRYTRETIGHMRTCAGVVVPPEAQQKRRARLEGD